MLTKAVTLIQLYLMLNIGLVVFSKDTCFEVNFSKFLQLINTQLLMPLSLIWRES